MTSTEIRSGFLEFFRGKSHTIVPSASLMPGSPNLLFTNAGMNQFVPYFLGEKKAPYSPPRAVDTQKCIRAGGKHNDLEDVGFDTYHHTFFEMLGNWSFGDYFKREAIQWAWELVVDTWGFPPQRLYATVYNPGPGDPAEFDAEAHTLWAELFSSAGLDPSVHVVNGSRKDNFWMMGETGPCGPCSELHVDLTPDGTTRGALVNKDDPRCIEIWNLVFIQFNANADGSFSPLPARHVDTGMGFERVAAIMQCTRQFTDFTRMVSNYETDVFRPLFDALGQLCGKAYGGSLPNSRTNQSASEKMDVAFRVAADHVRALAFSIADGIEPGNTDRNYVLRRILRRAVLYGRSLDLHEPFLHRLVPVLADTMGDVFPEIRERADHVAAVILREEEAFHRTIDKGVAMFEAAVAPLPAGSILPGDLAFRLYDEQGFPLDLTQLMAAERGLQVDTATFEQLMSAQRERARLARKSEAVEATSLDTSIETEFLGYEADATWAEVIATTTVGGLPAIVLDRSVCYGEMGGQVGDIGEILTADGQRLPIVDTRRAGAAIVHVLGEGTVPTPGTKVNVRINTNRRRAIERHHTATHLLHWAIHQVVGHDATQKGSSVGPEKFTFDFNSVPLTPRQLEDIERLVNERIMENAPVSAAQAPYSQVRERKDIMQLFGEKYPPVVRVVQIGGKPGSLDGYSMELCGGTHLRATGEAGLLRILSEGAVAAGVRRIEAVAGLPALDFTATRESLLLDLATKLNAPLPEALRRLEKLLENQRELEKSLQALQQSTADSAVAALIAANPTGPIIHSTTMPGSALQPMLNAFKQRAYTGLAILILDDGERLHLGVYSGEATRSSHPAGKLLQTLAPVAGGKGGGKPDMARGAAPDRSKLNELLETARRS